MPSYDIAGTLDLITIINRYIDLQKFFSLLIAYIYIYVYITNSEPNPHSL